MKYLSEMQISEITWELMVSSVRSRQIRMLKKLAAEYEYSDWREMTEEYIERVPESYKIFLFDVDEYEKETKDRTKN